MAEPASNLSGLYRFTSLARPIDPAYLTNRALLIVLPLVMLLSAGLSSIHDVGSTPVSAGLGAALVAFVAWALTRELAPDYNDAAFFALAIAWFLNVAFGVRLVLLLFVALLLVRLVNRSTGLRWRLLDTLGVLGFCAWAATSLQQPMILLITSVAFALDASLQDPLRRHYLAAAICIPVFVWMSLGDTVTLANDLGANDWGLIGLFAGGALLILLTQAEPVSYCDVSPDRLDPLRVKAGLVVGWLLAFQALLTSGASGWLETPIWACMLAVLISFVIRHAKKRPGNTIGG